MARSHQKGSTIHPRPQNPMDTERPRLLGTQRHCERAAIFGACHYDPDDSRLEREAIEDPAASYPRELPGTLCAEGEPRQVEAYLSPQLDPLGGTKSIEQPVSPPEGSAGMNRKKLGGASYGRRPQGKATELAPGRGQLQIGQWRGREIAERTAAPEAPVTTPPAGATLERAPSLDSAVAAARTEEALAEAGASDQVGQTDYRFSVDASSGCVSGSHAPIVAVSMGRSHGWMGLKSMVGENEAAALGSWNTAPTVPANSIRGPRKFDLAPRDKLPQPVSRAPLIH